VRLKLILLPVNFLNSNRLIRNFSNKFGDRLLLEVATLENPEPALINRLDFSHILLATTNLKPGVGEDLGWGVDRLREFQIILKFTWEY